MGFLTCLSSRVYTQRMLLTLIALTLSTSAYSAPPVPTPAPAPPWAATVKPQVDQKVKEHFGNESQVGIIVGVLRGNETHIWTYGERVKNGRERPKGNTFFEMGSITKTFTTTLLAHEVVNNRVSLFTPVKTLWPELAGTDAGEITLEQLATHTSGLPKMPGDYEPSFADPSQSAQAPQAFDAQKLLDFLKAYKNEAKTHPYLYSNLGVGLLGYLLSEKLNKESYADYLKRNLLIPIGLIDTKLTLTPTDQKRAAQGYDSFFRQMPATELDVLNPAGGLKTTMDDLLTYVRFNMRHNPKSALSRAANLAHQPRIPSTEDPALQIGLAWESYRLGEFSTIMHGGATSGYRANVVFDKEKKIGAVVLSNTDVLPRCLLAPIFGVSCDVVTWAKIDIVKLTDLVGRYRSADLKTGAEVFVENGFLGMQPEGLSRQRLWAHSENSFEIPSVGAKVDFLKNDSGVYEILRLELKGKFYDFVRE
jgi:serine-type D-Ala-D-Ala carboxypeptidase/endopeptidase